MKRTTMGALFLAATAAMFLVPAPGQALGYRGTMVAADRGGIGSGTNVGPICDPFEKDCWADVGIPTATYTLDCNDPCVALWAVYSGGAHLKVTNLDTGETNESNFPTVPKLYTHGMYQFWLTSSAWGTEPGLTSVTFH